MAIETNQDAPNAEKITGDVDVPKKTPEEENKERQEKIDKLEKELKSGGACGKNCAWITYALLAGMSMGVGAFFYASNFSEYGIIGTGIVAPGPFIMCLAIRLF